MKTRMRSILFFTLALLPTVAWCAERASNYPDDLYHASCRVQTGNVSGSGCIFHQTDDGDLWVLTNYHVAGKSDCNLDFVVDGKIVRVKGKNVWQGYDQTVSLDAVVLRVSASSVSSISDKLRFVPLYTGGSLDGEESMATSGSPSAQYPKKLEGRIRFNGTQNATFYPTPYGGQSGSSIFIQRNKHYYIGALLTWRTMDEGREEYGGLAQPITRVVSAMRGEVALSPCPLPENAIECPYRQKEGEVILSDGTKAWECAEVAKAKTPDLYVEFWSMQGCPYCVKAENEWIPSLRRRGYEVEKFMGDGEEADYARAVGISRYPTFRIIHMGAEDSIYVGYSPTVRSQVEAKLSILSKEDKARREYEAMEQALHKQEVADECEEDGSCLLLPSSPFRFFSVPATDGDEEVTEKFRYFDLPEPESDSGDDGVDGDTPEEPRRLLPRILPNLPKSKGNDDNGGVEEDKGKGGEDKKDKEKGESGGGLFRRLSPKNNLEDIVKQYYGRIIMGAIATAFIGCFLAIGVWKSCSKVIMAVLAGLKNMARNFVIGAKESITDATDKATK